MSRETSNDRTRLRESQRVRIEAFFRRRIGQKFTSAALHAWFGSSFRSRVSEINRDPAARIRIVNETDVDAGELGQRREQSFYRAERALKIHWPATPEEAEAAGYVLIRAGKCQGCGEDFLWHFTPSGKKMPLSMIDGPRLVPHHWRCKNARQFRQASAKHAARSNNSRPAPRPLQGSLFDPRG